MNVISIGHLLPPRTSKQRTALCHASALTVALVLAGITITQIDRSPPLEISNVIPLPALAHPGDTIMFRLTGMSRRICQGTMHERIVDATGAVHNRLDSPASAGLLRSIKLASNITDPGQFRYLVSFDWWCNPLQRLWPINVSAPPAEFEVAPSPVAAIETTAAPILVSAPPPALPVVAISAPLPRTRRPSPPAPVYLAPSPPPPSNATLSWLQRLFPAAPAKR